MFFTWTIRRIASKALLNSQIISHGCFSQRINKCRAARRRQQKPRFSRKLKAANGAGAESRTRPAGPAGPTATLPLQLAPDEAGALAVRRVGSAGGYDRFTACGNDWRYTL